MINIFLNNTIMKYVNLTKTKVIFDMKSIEDGISVFDGFKKVLVLTGKNHLKISDEYERVYRFFPPYLRNLWFFLK